MSPFGRLFLVLLCLFAFFAATRFVSRPFMDGESRVVDARDSGVSLAFLNPWRVVDESTRTYVDGDGARLDPQAPTASDLLFDDDDALLAAEEPPVEIGNEGETTAQGAEFDDLELPSDILADDEPMDWGGIASLSWKRETDLSYFNNYRRLEFQPIESIAGDEFLGKTLVVDGKPTYKPSEILGERQYDNAAEAAESNPPKVALNSEDSIERPAMKPVEKIQPGVAFIKSGYRRGGASLSSGTGTMGRVSTIPL